MSPCPRTDSLRGKLKMMAVHEEQGGTACSEVGDHVDVGGDERVEWRRKRAPKTSHIH